MVAREARLFGDLIETQRVVVAVIDEVARSAKAVKRVDVLNKGRVCALYDHVECESLYEYVASVKMVR
jgi:hypothetical protein